jgi:hypothetical protein
MAAPWHNPDGLEVKFPNYFSDKSNFVNRPRIVSTYGNEKQIQIDVELARIPAGTRTFTRDLNNDGTLDGFDTGDIYLPAYASVKEVAVYVTEAAAGGTSVTLGTFTLTGSTISVNSLITATEGAIANLDTLGARTYGAGALVATTAETASVGSVDAFLALTTAGTFTAGKLKIVITYTDVLADS